MDAFQVVRGIVAPMLAANIDTDVIMPKQFLKGVDRKGLDQGVFFDQRFLASGELNPEFVLNQPRWHDAKFLVVGQNFGCGSSREHAVWGLKQVGIRALIGTSFAGIFYDNCQRNGLLLIELDKEQIQIIEAFSQKGSGEEICIDLPNQKILLPEQDSLSFNIDPIRKNALLEGLDAIGSTLKMVSSINIFEEGYLRDNPWLG